MEGRDIGTVVFPDATVKLFLDASVEARGERRFDQQGDSAAGASRAAITRDIAERDTRDRTREASPLRPAADAVVIDTTGMPLRPCWRRAVALVAAAVPPLNPSTLQSRIPTQASCRTVFPRVCYSRPNRRGNTDRHFPTEAALCCTSMRTFCQLGGLYGTGHSQVV